MEINIKNLLTIQKDVNDVVRERLGAEIDAEQFVLAFNVELFEYFNAIGVWKWWKQSHKVDRERILDELADCFAFFLSMVEQLEKEYGEEVVISIQSDLNTNFQSLSDTSDNVERQIDSVFRYIGNNADVVYHTLGHQRTFKDTEYDSNADMIVISSTVGRFAFAIYLATLLFEGIAWEELTQAYRKKSEVNINRQKEGY